MRPITRRSTVAVALTCGALVAAPAWTTSAVAGDDARGGVVRWSGADRYELSANIAVENYEPGLARVFVASGEVFTDALSGAPIAARDEGPILLVKATSIPAAVMDALTALQPQQVVVLGGENSVSRDVFNQIKNMFPAERWAGPDRYSASAKMSKLSFNPGVRRAFIASGAVFPDALSVGPVAGMTPGPTLLVESDNVPGSIRSELRRLMPKNIVVVGGESTLTPQLFGDLQQYTTGTVTRWSGEDRYATSAAISRASFKSGVNTVYVASGQVFPDALSGGPVAGMKDSPLLLVHPDGIPGFIEQEVLRLKPANIVVLGGPATISDETMALLEDYVR